MPDAAHAVWRQLHWSRPVDPIHAVAALRHWAADQRSPHLTLEVRADQDGVRYLLGTSPSALRAVLAPLQPLLSSIAPLDGGRPPIALAGRLSASTRHRPLRADELPLASRAVLSALTQVGKDEALVVQLVLGPRRVPLAIPNESPSSIVAPWWEVAWRGNGQRVDGEKRAALRNKVGDHGFACTVRLGVSAATPSRRHGLLLGLLAAVRTSEAAGLHLRLHAEAPTRLNGATRPWRWPLRLNVHELAALTGWPLGDDDLPGQPPLHPRLLPPLPGMLGKQRIVAAAGSPGREDDRLALPVRAALQHLHVVGPTGVGKSTLLAELIRQDLEDGRAVVVIEPKGDLVVLPTEVGDAAGGDTPRSMILN